MEVREVEPTTGQCLVQVTNPGDHLENIRLPALSVLTHPKLQDLMLMEARTLTVPARGRTQFKVMALCVGDRKEPATGRDFQWTSGESHPEAMRVRRILETCRRLQSAGDLPPLPLVTGQQLRVITQFAYWKEQNMLDKGELAKLLHDQLKPSPEKESEVQKATDNLWEGVNLTLKGTPSQ